MDLPNELGELDERLVLPNIAFLRLQLDDLVEVVFCAANNANDCRMF